MANNGSGINVRKSYAETLKLLLTYSDFMAFMRCCAGLTFLAMNIIAYAKYQYNNDVRHIWIEEIITGGRKNLFNWYCIRIDGLHRSKCGHAQEDTLFEAKNNSINCAKFDIGEIVQMSLF